MPLQENALFGGFDRDIAPFNVDKIGDFKTPPVYSVPCVWRRTDENSLEYIPKKIELIQFMNELN